MLIEQIGTAKIDRGTIRSEIKFKKDQIRQDTIAVRNVISQLSQLCDTMRNVSANINCKTATDQLNHKQTELQWLVKGLETSILKRQKRGVLGKILTAVFGVNDEVYQDINNLRENQKELIQASKHQTKFMIQALSRFNETDQRIENKLNHFKEKLEKGLEITKLMENWYSKGMENWYRQVDENRLALHLVSTHQVANTYIDELLNLYKNLLNLHFNKGHLFEIISPAQIEEIIIQANHKLQNDVEVLSHPMYKTGVDHSEENIHIYGYFYITEKTEFLLVKTPQKIEKNRYWTFDIPNEILGIDYNSQRYFMEPTKEFSRNIRIHEHSYIASPAQRRRQIKPNRNCDTIAKLLNQNKNSNNNTTTHGIDTSTDDIHAANLTWSEHHSTSKPQVDSAQEVVEVPDDLLDLKQDQEELFDHLQNTQWQTVTNHSSITSAITTAVILAIIKAVSGIKYSWKRIKKLRNQTKDNRQGRTNGTKTSTQSNSSEESNEYELQPLKSIK
ncbi:hypothetical protein ABEB36_014658 [Hypothenemus hampei]|uniref:Uncharacterized protein n=1 Tax=Hypothenemus hampei TaxID=57062 RepID=A0ABD1E2Q2_HYPHA